MAINVAVIGLGKMGLSHLSIINSLPDFRVVAICDSAPLVGDVIAKYSGLSFVREFDQVLEVPDLQAIVIATPTPSHAVLVEKALARGLHVFCEKPLTLSEQDSIRIAAMAASKGLIAQVGYHNRFIGTFREVKQLLGTGALGRITHVLAEAYGPVVLRPTKPTWRGKAGQGGGCLYDYAAHPLNLVNWYFGAPIGCSGAKLKRLFSAEVEDEVYAHLDFSGGLTCQLSVNWSDASVRKMTTRISIWGEGGKIYADRQEIQVFLNGSVPVPAGWEPGWTVRYITDLTPPVSFYLRGEEYTAQLEAFGQAIVGRTGQCENDFASSVETDATIELIRRAADNPTGAGDLRAQPGPARPGGVLARLLGR